MKFRLFFSRLSWPVLFVSMLLQRSPVVRFIAEAEFSLLPRIQHLLRAAVAAVSVGAYNSVTAATGDIQFRSGRSDTTVAVGEDLLLVIEVQGGLTPETWIVIGNLPAGVKSTINFGIGIVTIDGKPTEPGSFPITIQAWQDANMQGARGPDLDFTIVVEAVGPVITQHPSPANQVVAWGDTLNLSTMVKTPAGTTYQWQRILGGEVDYSNMEGKTENVLTLEKMTKADEGMYRVVATDSTGSVQSNAAMVTVSATAFQSWREVNFEDPFSSEASLDRDPDLDTLINAVEFTFGLNPNSPEMDALVRMSREEIEGVLYIVYTFPPVSEGGGSAVTFESNSTPDVSGWTPLANGVDGTIIESTLESYLVKIPAVERVFNRLRIVSN